MTCGRPGARHHGELIADGARGLAGVAARHWGVYGLAEPGVALQSPDSHDRTRGYWVKTFPTANIRNVALVGHGGAGKTSLAEALLLDAGAIPRLGKVEDGTTVCDFDPEEQRRRISVSLALAPFEVDGTKVNLLDAPGYADFVGDVAAAFQAADIALFVVSAVEGVEVQTEIAWKLAEARGLPRAIFVNKLDRERCIVFAHAGPAERALRCGCRAAAPPDRRGGRIQRRRRAAQRSGDHLCGWIAARHRRADTARDASARNTPFTTRSWRASSSATTI